MLCEASFESDDPQLTLAMLQETNSLILIVENSTKAEKIDQLAFWHQVLAGVVRLPGYLDIHGPSRACVHFDISPHPEPAVLLDHVKLLGFFLIFDPFLKGKTREYSPVILKLIKTCQRYSYAFLTSNRLNSPQMS